MIHRPRRLRKNPIIRELVAETGFSSDKLIYPYFVIPGRGRTEAIRSMPGIHRFSIDLLIKDIGEGLEFGLNKILLFGVGDAKSEDGKSSWDPHSLVPELIRQLRKNFGEDLYIISDICLCAYTSHGHCGIIRNDEVQNDASLDALSRMALVHAEAGADMVAPSDMMDGRVAAIRQKLDENNLTNTAIMSYSTKFASAYYGPFREAAESAPAQGDRKSYQMDFRNTREALREAALDEGEGADILMVKPALAYLDIMKEIRRNTNLPLACYNVSGEYAMVKAAAAQGFLDERQIVMENMRAFARAGADIVISYHSREVLKNGWA